MSYVSGEHIIKCVNEHDKLLEKVREQENEISQLKQALSICSPFNAGYCKFCWIDSLTEEHKPDCEYLKLCGGAE